jgi:hypothetical protein
MNIPDPTFSCLAREQRGQYFSNDCYGTAEAWRESRGVEFIPPPPHQKKRKLSMKNWSIDVWGYFSQTVILRYHTWSAKNLSMNTASVQEFSQSNPVAEFIGSARELKPALKLGLSGVEGGVWLIPSFNPTLKMVFTPVQDLWIRLLD